MKKVQLKIDFNSINRKIKRDDFDCGNKELNDYFQRYARQNHEHGISKCFVALTEKNHPVGFYTLSAAQVTKASLSADTLSKTPNYPIPAVRIGKLAVDKKFKGQGIGKLLLVDAFKRILSVEDIAIKVVVVDAKDEAAADFYLKYGFIRFQDNPGSLFIPIETVRMAF